MPFRSNAAREEYQRRQPEHVSELPGVAVIANDHLVFGCGIQERQQSMWVTKKSQED